MDILNRIALIRNERRDLAERDHVLKAELIRLVQMALAEHHWRDVSTALGGVSKVRVWQLAHSLEVLEPDRYVKIKDRSKDIIISGGESISSIEVEDALYQHPAVMVCTVVAMPNPKGGKTPLAYVELKPGAAATAEELIAHCRGLLAGYKVPKEVRFEAIPKTPTGKIQKLQLRERAKSASAIE